MADKDKRQNKKLDRIERRLDRGMKSKRQAERNLDRAEKITHKANRAGNFETYNRATTLADMSLNQYANFSEGADVFNNPINKTGPFYKTGCINYDK